MFHRSKPIARIVAAIIFAAPLGFAADPVSVGGPVSAAVFDSRSQSIRQVTGFPGASLLGATLADRLDAAEVAPNGNAALAVRDGQWFAISSLAAGNPVWTPLVPATPGTDRAVWNRDSSAAALYSSATRSVIVVSGISDAGGSQAAIGLDPLAGDVTALALERSGAAAIVGLAGEAGGLYLLTPQTPPALLARINRPAAISLIQDKDLLVADADTLQVFQLLDYHGASALVPFANLPDGATKPVGLAMSPDGQFVFAADKACRCLAVYQFSTGFQLDQIALEAEPSFLKPVSLGRQFLVNSPSASDTPFWMLSAGNPPAVYFVPGGVQ